MSIVIDNGHIKFVNPNNAGMIGKQEDFNILLKSIKIIGIKLAIIVDDFEYFIVLIDDKQNVYILNSCFFDEQSFRKLQEVYGLSLDVASYKDNEYKEGRSIIVYPNHHYGKPLFKRRMSFFETSKLFFEKLFLGTNPALGYLSDESKYIVTSDR